MPRDKANAIDVLEALRVRVRDQLLLDDRSCYITDDPLNVLIPHHGEMWVSVAPGTGTFDDALMTGTILQQCTKDMKVQLTGYSRVHLDDADRSTESFLAATRGMLAMEKRLIQAIGEVDLVINDEPFLRELLRPTFVQYRRLQVDADGGAEAGLPFNAVIIDVPVVFDMDLG